MLINEDTSVQEVVSGDDPILVKVKGNCIPELELKVLLHKHRDMFKSALPDVSVIKH
jgi:hypothetical protein